MHFEKIGSNVARGPPHEPHARHIWRLLLHTTIDRFDPASHHPFTEDISTPKLLISEEDQWVRQELIETLNDFKQLIIAHLSPRIQQFTSYVKKSSVGHSVDTRSFHHHKRTRIKSQKSVVKVIHDMWIEKWIFIKRGKHLTALIKVVRFLEALRLPP
jgi:hypothetical protein